MPDLDNPSTHELSNELVAPLNGAPHYAAQYVSAVTNIANTSLFHEAEFYDKLHSIWSKGRMDYNNIFITSFVYAPPMDPDTPFYDEIARVDACVYHQITWAVGYEKGLADITSGSYEFKDCEIHKAKSSTMKKIGQHLLQAHEIYEKLEQEHPTLAHYALRSTSALLQTLVAGPTGLLNFIRGELTGLALNEIVGEKLSEGIGHLINQGTNILLKSYPELDHHEARAIAAASLIAPATAVDSTTGLKEVFTQIKIKKTYLASVDKVNSRFPINGDYAGKKMHMDDVTPTMKDKHPYLKEKYPDGVAFDEKGFPRFEPYATNSIKLEKFSGVHETDVRRANELAGIKIEPKGYTWHHHEDGKTMQLVPTDLHDAVRHTGGMAIFRANEKNK